MKPICFSIIFGILAVSQSLFAHSLECIGANVALHYSFVQSDGGAAMRSSEDLVVNRVVLIKSQPPQGVISKLAQFQLVKKSTPKVTSQGFEKTSTFTAIANVTMLSGTNPLSAYAVNCKEIVYTGPPRP